MPDIQSQLEFLSDLDLYKTQRPFLFTPSRHLEGMVDVTPKTLNTINLGWKPIVFRDIRGHEASYSLGEAGFETVKFLPANSEFDSFSSKETRQAYMAETEDFLKARFNANEVICYNVKIRHNKQWDPDEVVDPTQYDWLEPPARGVHDFSFEHAPSIIIKQLQDAGKGEYLVPGYRYRIVNTWRPLLPVLENNPLAFCDSRTVDPEDLVTADRILPSEYWSLYFLKYNPDQKWHWISKQTPDELTLLMMFDSKPGGARYCCHSSFVNPLEPEGAPRRQSIETRSVIVTQE